MVGLIIFGVILLGAGIGLFVARAFALGKVRQLRGATARTAGELREMAAQVAGELGPGSYNEVVEVRGQIACDSPLISELGQQPCVHYRHTITQEYEEVRVTTDDAGNQTQERHRSSESVASMKRSCPFRILDPTGSIDVLPDGADITAEQSVSRYEPETNMMAGGGGMIRFGGFAMQMGSGMMGMGGQRRVLGYRLNEWILPVGRRGFVIGEATDAEGELALRKPSQKGYKFIIASGSKEALLQATEKKGLILLVAAIVCAVAGVALLVSAPFAG